MAFGGIIAYSGSDQSTVKAEIIPKYREIAVLKPVEVPTINVDLNTNTIAVEGTPTATVNINQPERTIVKWKTKIVERFVPFNYPNVDATKHTLPVLNLPKTSVIDKIDWKYERP